MSVSDKFTPFVYTGSNTSTTVYGYYSPPPVDADHILFIDWICVNNKSAGQNVTVNLKDGDGRVPLVHLVIAGADIPKFAGVALWVPSGRTLELVFASATAGHAITYALMGKLYSIIKS